jgi:putative phage-type endonuclease
MTEMTEPAQRSKEWFEKRKGRVTGSVVGGILGLSPYMTRSDVLRNMVREALGAEREFQGNVATDYGSFNESGAMVEFQMESGLKCKEAYFIQHEDWLGASPDAWVSDGGLLEIKCPYGLRAEPDPVFKAPEDQPHYLAQMQVQMFVARVQHCHFYQWSAHGSRLDRIERDDDWLADNLPRLKQFHAEFLDELANNPEEHLGPKRPEIDTPEARRMMAEWDELNEQLERAAERKKDLLEEMVTLAGGKNALLAGRKLTMTSRAGAISYTKAIKALCPDADLEPYRGKPSTFWQVR